MVHKRSPDRRRRSYERYLRLLEMRRLRRQMWDTAHRDREIKEVTSAGDYRLHPLIPIQAGDVLISGVRYIHPALTKPFPTKKDAHSRKAWESLLQELPKRKIKISSPRL